MCLRGDTDFSLTGHFEHWAQRVDFVFGMDEQYVNTRQGGPIESVGSIEVASRS